MGLSTWPSGATAPGVSQSVGVMLVGLSWILGVFPAGPISTYTYIHMQTCMYTYMFAYVYIYIYVYVYTSMQKLDFCFDECICPYKH